MVDWSAQLLTCVVFPAPQEAQLDVLQTWTKLFKSSPENLNTVPSGVPGTQGVAAAHGRVGDYQFVLSSQAGRMDLAISLAPADDGPFLISDTGSALELIERYAGELIDEQRLLRLSLVANLGVEVDSLEAGARQFREQLDLKDVPDTATDLSFSINVRRPSAVKDIVFNRVCRWQTLAHQLFQVQMSFGAASPAAAAPSIVRQRYTSSLVLDLNNVPVSEPMTAAEAKAIFHELVGEARALMSDGYARLTAS